MSKLLLSLKQFFSLQDRKKTFWVAYSGGLDSHVLLDLCYRLKKEMVLQIKALHINHGLSVNAAKWANHCAMICQSYDIEYHVQNWQIKKEIGESLEEVARDIRYQLLAAHLKEGDMLLTAHQQDDQAETLLLQLCRGAGPAGLSAMPIKKKIGLGWHYRPLLCFSREELAHYAKTNSLNWVEDESNNNTLLTRNFIRQTILPTLKTRWPTITATLTRSALHCAEAQNLLAEFGTSLLVKVKGTKPHTLSIRQLLSETFLKQRLLIRIWIAAQRFPLPPTKILQQIQQTVLVARSDRQPQITWAGLVLKRFKDDLYLMQSLPSSSHLATQLFEWNLTSDLALPGLGRLTVQKKLACGITDSIRSVRVQFRRGGEKTNVFKHGRHKLKNLFQKWQVPPWERPFVPLIFSGSRLISVVGYFIDPEFAAKENELGIEVILERTI